MLVTDDEPASVDNFLNQLLQHIHKKIDNDPSGMTAIIDLARSSSFFTIDVITRLAFGEEIGCLKSDSDVFHVARAIREMTEIASVSLMVPWIRAITTSSLFQQLLGPKSTDEKGLGRLIRYVLNLFFFFRDGVSLI